MRTGTLGTATLGKVIAAAALCASAAAVGALGAGAGADTPNGQTKVALPGEMPTLPTGTTETGPVPSGEMLHLDVGLAGQDPTGLAQEVAAVSTPSSPEYRQYLTASQFAAEFGPTADEVSSVSASLRAEGLTVGTPDPGSSLLPVSGTAATVSAAFATPLESVSLPGHVASFVNTAPPQVPADVSPDITGIVGLDGISAEHSMIRSQPTAASTGSSGTGSSGTGSTSTGHQVVAHAAGPQACGSAGVATARGGYTSTQLASIYGLDQLFAQGRTGIGQTIGVVEFEQYSASDIATFESCYGLGNPVRTVTVDGTPGGPAAGTGESALDIELAAVSAPSASIIVYEAPNEISDASSLDLFNRMASDDLAQTLSTSWGICEEDLAAGAAGQEGTIFARMAVQGQTMVAASGDAGSEDCYDTDGGTELAVDDPGSQPDVLSAGGTSLPSGSVGAQSVWNNCGVQDLGICQSSSSSGAGGGGLSVNFARPSWQPAPSDAGNGSCHSATGCRVTPDFSGSADPDNGVVAYFANGGGWSVFGGTSAVAPAAAGLFADTNQGCAGNVGLVGPALYAHANSSTFTDITAGSNDFTATNGGAYTASGGFDAASGLGTPIEQNLAIAVQGGSGCPSVAALSSHSGPVSGSPAITIAGGGFNSATAVSFGSAGTGQIVSHSETSLVVIPPSPGRTLCVDVTVSNPQGISVTSTADRYGFGGGSNCNGYRFVASDGGIFDFGSAPFEGSIGGGSLSAPIVGMAATPSGNGYWLAASDGGVFNFGDAPFYGSIGGSHLNRPIVGIAATPSGNGYWLVASDGGIFGFGGARFFGSTGNITLNRPIVGMASSADGLGYWLVASDGGIFGYGDAAFHGSTGNIHLNQPIVGMAASGGGGGYWLVASDGGIFNFGNAPFAGSTGNIRLNQPIVGMAATPDGGGYWLVASDGGVFSFGDAPFYGSTGNLHLNRPIVGMSAG
ncbi:MAG TPA: protease pro-enzyme activation domain-containing protein [Acidimicrobiales bacterium]